MYFVKDYFNRINLTQETKKLTIYIIFKCKKFNLKNKFLKLN